MKIQKINRIFKHYQQFLAKKKTIQSFFTCSFFHFRNIYISCHTKRILSHKNKGDKKMTKTERIQFRVSEKQKNFIRKKCEERKITISEFMTESLFLLYHNLREEQ